MRRDEESIVPESGPLLIPSTAAVSLEHAAQRQTHLVGSAECRPHPDWNSSTLSAFLIFVWSWVFIPGMALLVGALPFLNERHRDTQQLS
jgi:hypothetical protein